MSCNVENIQCVISQYYVKIVNGSRYYRALESVSIASASSSALTIYPCQTRVHQTLAVLNSQLGRRSGGRPQRTVYPRRLPVIYDTHTTLAGIEPTTFRLLVRRDRATETTTELQNTMTVNMLLN